MVAGLEMGWTAEAVLRASLHGGLAAVVAWGLCRVWKTMPPRVAVWVWRLVLLRFLAALFFRPWEVPLGGLQFVEGLRDAFGFGGSPATVSVESVMVSATVGGAWGLADMACLVWILGAGLGMLALVAAAVQGSARLRTIPPCRHQRTLATAAEVAAAVGLRRPPEVAASLADESPYLAGVWRPVVVAPSPWNFDAAELRLVFAHEFAHLRGRHLLWTWLAAATCRLFFFHPLAWLAARRLNLAQELAADQEAVAAVRGRTSDLGGLLVKMAGLASPDERRIQLALGPSSGCDALMERLRSLQRYRAPNAERRLPLVLGALFAAASLGAVWTPTTARPANAAAFPKESADLARDERRIERDAPVGGATRRAPTVILSHPRMTADSVANRLAPESASRLRKPLVENHCQDDAALAAEFKARMQLLEALGFCPDAVSLRESGREGLAVWQLELQQRRVEPPSPEGPLLASRPR